MNDNELFELCTVNGCSGKYLARGYCRKHYLRWYKGKDVTAPTIHDDRPPIVEGNNVKIPLGVGGKDGYTIIDKDNISLSRMKWFLAPNGYPTTNTSKGILPIHRFIMGSEEGSVVDHINRNKLDNRRSNLRLVTRSQNSMNKPPNKVRKDSQYKGVIKHQDGKWNAKIGFNNKLISLGYFDSEIDAANAYDKAALVYHREYAYVNDVELRELLLNVREKLGWVVTCADDLLDKLPLPLIYNGNDCAIELRRTKNDKYKWSANIRGSNGQDFKQIADTPLKALLKLTLELNKKGLLDAKDN